MHLTKPTLLLLALAISASCVSATPHQNLLEDVWHDLGHAGQAFAEGLIGIHKNGSAIADDFFGSLHNSTSEFANQAAEYAHRIADAVHRAVGQGLGEFASVLRAAVEGLQRSIDRVSNLAKRQTLNSALATLQTIETANSDLKKAVESINQQITQKKLQYAKEIQANWYDWDNYQLERVDNQTDGEGLQEAEEIINELRNRYASYLQSCIQELQTRHALFEQNVHQTVSGLRNSTDDLMGQIDVCLKLTTAPITCRRGIRQALQPLKSAPRELLNLKLQGVRLMVVGLSASGCVGQTLIDHELEKPSVERELDEIIWRYQESRASTAVDSSVSSDSGSNSEEGGSTPDDSSASEGDSSSEEGGSTPDDSSASDGDASSEEGGSTPDDSSASDGDSSSEEGGSTPDDSSASDGDASSEEGGSTPDDSSSSEGDSSSEEGGSNSDDSSSSEGDSSSGSNSDDSSASEDASDAVTTQ